MTKTSQNFVQGSFPINLTKYAIKTGVTFWHRQTFMKINAFHLSQGMKNIHRSKTYQ